jgi:CHAD domain-containing protein
MAYKFYADEPMRAAIVRCGREQLDRAIGELSEGINKDPVGAVHNARKAIKKERSLLRLARGAMAPKQRRRENAALRDAARGLSGARDAEVMLATVGDLSDRFAGQLPAKTFDAIRKHLKSRRGGQGNGAVGSALDDRAVQELGAVRLRVDDWKLREGGWKAIEDGLLRSYERGRKAFGRARDRRSLDDLHAWRKRVKDLWYHERLLAPSCGPTIAGQAKDAHHVADLLGDDHDLGLLRQELTGNAIPAPVDVDGVITLIDHRRDELQAEAIRLGERIYAESPKGFRRRMRRSWRAGRATASVPYEHDPKELAAATREPHQS